MLFSLESLLQTERQRVDDEHVERERRQREAERARHAQAEAERERERQAMVQAEQARQALEQREREEAARLAAVREAELRRIEQGSARQGELELMSRREEHERKLSAIRADVGHRRARFWSLMTAGSVLVGAGLSAAIYLGKAPAATSDEGYRDMFQTQQGLIERTAEKARNAERERDLARRESDDLKERLRLLEQKKPTDKPGIGLQRPSPLRDEKPKPCVGGDPDDPMNPCLKK